MKYRIEGILCRGKKHQTIASSERYRLKNPILSKCLEAEMSEETLKSSTQQYAYDIALSFAGEDRVCADALAKALRLRGLDIFYDKYEKSTLWGKNLYTYLSDIYQNKARYCVMFLSQHYATKLWTNHERESAQARAFRENEEYILPIRLDDTEIPGIPLTIAYLSWPPETAETIAEAIMVKFGTALYKGKVSSPLVSLKLEGARVLWVDDNPFNIGYPKDALEVLGVQFTMSTSTEDALEKMHRLKYDVVISDMGRPSDMRAGYTLLEELQKRGINIPFIICSSSDRPEHKAEAAKRGAFGSTNNSQELFNLVISALVR
jgi:CheY-like chemotaxis protein